MPRAFTDSEKERIRARLLEKASDYFARYGLRKTNVEELTKAAGISKGAFYFFFPSKEELFLAVLNQLESAQRARIAAHPINPRLSPQKNMKALMKEAFLFWDSSSLLTRFSKEDYAYLLRKLPPEKVAESLRADQSFFADILDHWRRAGLPLAHKADATRGLMYALFFFHLHRDDLQPDLHAQTMDLLLEMISAYLVGKNP